jgi:broad specificity phosphatase PhoE
VTTSSRYSRRPAAARLLASSLLVACFATGHAAAEGGGGAGATTILLVRHAEKLTDGRDPALSPEGRSRAEELARVLADSAPDALWASQFRRARETLEPLSAALGLEIAVDPIEGGDVQGWADATARRLRREYGGRTVVIAGHSNTVPALIGALGIAGVPQIGEGDYDDLFVVGLDSGGGARLLHLHYGARSGP